MGNNDRPFSHLLCQLILGYGQQGSGGGSTQHFSAQQGGAKQTHSEAQSERVLILGTALTVCRCGGASVLHRIATVTMVRCTPIDS